MQAHFTGVKNCLTLYGEMKTFLAWASSALQLSYSCQTITHLHCTTGSHMYVTCLINVFVTGIKIVGK